jgi:hypothetical protein
MEEKTMSPYKRYHRAIVHDDGTVESMWATLLNTVTWKTCYFQNAAGEIPDFLFPSPRFKMAMMILSYFEPEVGGVTPHMIIELLIMTWFRHPRLKRLSAQQLVMFGYLIDAQYLVDIYELLVGHGFLEERCLAVRHAIFLGAKQPPQLGFTEVPSGVEVLTHTPC